MKLNPSRCTLLAILLAFGALMDVLPAQEAVPKSLPLGVAGAQDAGVKPAADDAVKDVFTSTGAAESVLEGYLAQRMRLNVEKRLLPSFDEYLLEQKKPSGESMATAPKGEQK